MALYAVTLNVRQNKPEAGGERPVIIEKEFIVECKDIRTLKRIVPHKEDSDDLNVWWNIALFKPLKPKDLKEAIRK